MQRDDVPPWLRAHAVAISRACLVVVGAAALVQVADLFAEEDASPWVPIGILYLSAAALGLEAMAVGVRKQLGRGPSIANLAPGGWAIFAAMFWILAVPAYFFGARKRRAIAEPDAPSEPVTWGSWVAIGTFALLGLVLIAAGLR